MPPTSKPITLAVNLSSKARAVVDQLRAETGVPATTATERFFEWLMSMPPKFRLAILNRDEAAQDELLVAWVREHLSAKGLTAAALEPDDFAGRVRLMNKLLNEMHATYEGTKDAALAAKRKRG